MLRVIIESPYAATPERGIEENTIYARCCLFDSLERGEAPMASHLLYPQVLHEQDPKQRSRGIQCGYEWMAACDLVAFYIDQGWSPGMLQALKVARLLQKNIQLRQMCGRERNKLPLEVKELVTHLEATGLEVHTLGWGSSHD